MGSWFQREIGFEELQSLGPQFLLDATSGSDISHYIKHLDSIFYSKQTPG